MSILTEDLRTLLSMRDKTAELYKDYEKAATVYQAAEKTTKQLVMRLAPGLRTVGAVVIDNHVCTANASGDIVITKIAEIDVQVGKA